MSGRGWTVARHRGEAGELHALTVPVGAGRQVWCLEVERAALVLGSAQPSDTIDEAACAAAGVDVARRRSGGGSVLMLPDEVVWLDVVIGRDDPLWDDDITRSSWWLGEVWCAALASLGVVEPTVHRGRAVPSVWSASVCFAGLGPGEVTVGGAKLVGISQRRTRAWARMQCAFHRQWRPAMVASLLQAPRPGPSELAGLVASFDVAPPAIVAAFDDALHRLT